MGYGGLRWIASYADEMGISNTIGLHDLRCCCISDVCTVRARCVHKIGGALLVEEHAMWPVETESRPSRPGRPKANSDAGFLRVWVPSEAVQEPSKPTW